MCLRPCWPTPEEAKAMIAAGLADKMMLDYWCGSPDIYIVCPAEVGYAGKRAAVWPGGDGCVLQTDEGLCLVHGSGFKPFEARVSHHGRQNNLVHEYVARLWNTPDGRAVVSIWKRAVGMPEEEQYERDGDWGDWPLN